ncbi:MAG: filamentous hemagglutinin N-terminal domain-containing protein [Acidiphilium sp.]|nr:filamentous hemagglutinin N-terminal domain-containing protein [Acidiphilium sp.]MDD4936616.1 filamentous hemagglutinin N-terminal domain-containing protein [Acidiphilium sp.]
MMNSGQHFTTDGTGRRRLLLASTALSAALLAAAPALSNPPAIAAGTTPQGGQVVGGQASIAQAPGVVSITQSSARTAIDWQSFNVGAGAKVTFKQPNAQAIALNRVISNNPSIIAGRINANGQIVLMNQSGVVFTPGSQVNAESLVVSTAGISARNFMAGHMVFDAPPKPGARIVNDGTITMKQAGLAAFVAPQVVNRGTIIATLGHVILAGASTFTLDISGDGLVSIDVTQAVRKIDLGGRVVDALVTNQGLIVANGGTVTLTAQAIDGVIQQLLDVRGVVQADSVGKSQGAITIAGIGGDLQVAGSLLARGTQPGAVGGTIAVDATGAVQVASAARIDASGMAGGGVVALGTDAARAVKGPADKAAPKAQTVSVAAGAVVTADATQAGNGGDIALMSAQRTTQSGALSAQGRAHGGMIETSSDGVISLSGTETVFAAHGESGTILLDPATLIVDTGHAGNQAGTTTSGGVTTIGGDTGPKSYVDPGSLDALTGTIILTASSLLSVASAIDLASATSVLTLASGGDVSIGASVLVGGSLEVDAAGTIGIGAPITAPNITLDDRGTGGIGIAANISASGQLAMLSGGTIAEASGGYVTTGTLTSGNGTIGGDVLLTESPTALGANNIGTLGGFTAANNFELEGGTSTLLVAGTLDAATATLAGGRITVDAPISVSGVLALAGNAGISQDSAGALTAGTLTSGGTTIGGSAIQLGNATNTIGTLGAFATTDDFVLNDLGHALVLAGPFSAPSASIAADGLRIDGPVTTGVLTLASDAGITEGAATTFAAGTLTTTDGTITGDVALSGTSNAIGTLGAFTASGTLLLRDQAPLSVTGPVSANGIGLIDAGALTLASSLSVGSGAAIDLVANAITDNNTTLTAPTGTIALAPFTPGTPLDFGGNLAAALAIAPTLVSAIALSGEHDLNLGQVIAGGGTYNAATVVTEGALPGFTGTLAITGQTTFINSADLQADFESLTGGGITNNGLIDAATLALTGTQFGGTGAVSANNLTGRFSQSAVFDNATDAVGLITGLTAGSGGILLLDGATLTIGGTMAVASGSSLILAADAIMLGTQGTILAPAGSVTFEPLTAGLPVAVGGMAASTLDLGTALLGAVGPNAASLIIGGALSGALTVAAPVSLTIPDIVLHGNGIAIDAGLMAGNILDLESAGSISQIAPIAATTLIGGAAANTVLQNANTIGTLGAFSDPGGWLALTDTGTLVVAGPVSVPTIALAATGLTIPGNITAGSLSLSASAGSIIGGGDISATMLTGLAGYLALTGPNHIATLGQLGVTNAATFNDAAPLTIAGPVSAALFALGDTGAITETGTINATTLQSFGTIGGDVALTGANSIAILGSFAGAAAVTLDDVAPLSIAGPLTAASATMATGALDIPGNIATGMLSLASTGAITETGTLDATVLSGTAAGTMALTGTNSIGSLGNLTTGGDTVIDDGTTLNVDGALSAPDVTITATAIGVNGSVDTGLLSLSSAGTIAGGGPITAATLTGSAGTLMALTGTNAVGTLGNFTATGNISLNDATPLLIAGSIALPGTLGFADPGSITETGGISAATFTSFGPGVGGAAEFGGINTIASLGGFTATGDLVFTDTTDFTVAGAVKAANITLVTPGIINESGSITTATLSGSASGMALGGANSVTALGAMSVANALRFNDIAPLVIAAPITAGSLALGDTGAISASGGISAGTLASIGTIGGAVGLTGHNHIGTLGNFAGAGTVTLDDSVPLIITGPFSAANATLSTGALTIPGTITTGSLALFSAGAVTATGPIDATLVSGNAAGRLTLTGANHIATLGSFTATGDAVIDDATDLDIAGPFTAPDATIMAAAITIPGTIGVGGTLALGSAGSITESGTIMAHRLTSQGTIGGIVDLTGTNTIGALGDFAATADIILADTAPLPIAGTLAAPNVTLRAPGLTIPGDIAVTGEVSLASLGTISETGTIDAGLLTGSSAGPAGLSGTNSIATLGNFTVTDGGFDLTDATPLVVTGPVRANTIGLIAPAITIPGRIATPGTLTLGGGNVTESGGIDAKMLQSHGALGGDAGFTGVNQIATLGSFNDAGHDLTLNDAGALSLAGPVSARVVSIAATGQLVLDGIAGGGLFIQGQALTTPTRPQVQPRVGLDSVLAVTNGGAQQLLQTGVFDIDTGPIALAKGLAAQPNTVFMMLPSHGSATFAGLQAPNTTLVLDLGGGKSTGQMALHFLVVAGNTVGQVNFDGSLGNLPGQAAAHNGVVVPVPGSNYRFNACIIGSVNCTVLPVATLPQASPLQDFDLNPPRRRHLDRNVRLPGVAAKDY